MLVVLLTVNSGAIDAIGLLALGGAFASVMTGNLVLTGVGTAQGDGELVRLAAGAVVCFMLGCLLGSRVAGNPHPDDPEWPTAVTTALGIELGLTVAFGLGWEYSLTAPSGTTALLLLLTNAVALGVQSSAVQRFGVSGLSTTYLTGTLTTMVMQLAHGRFRAVGLKAALIGGLLTGAVSGTLLCEHAPRWVPALPAVCVGGVMTASRFAFERAESVSCAAASSNSAPADGPLRDLYGTDDARRPPHVPVPQEVPEL